TARGLDVLAAFAQNSLEIENVFLNPRADLVEYLNENFPVESDEDSNLPTLEGSFRDIYQRMRDGLVTELLQRINSKSPDFFEDLVIKLLVEMGYGGSLEDAETVGHSGDRGIDGIIREDTLGLDMIYIQAKRWREGSVGRPELQKFVGALHERNARKGIFITTSDFTISAITYVERIASNIILIDGDQLVELMIDYDVGVSSIETFEIKRVDSDYFDESTE
ncbi:restriction endonuclease, partial [Candidatus Poribacteria bacterium]|nr:restriction endonuclease [Candidatus Poribacteria bacterium]